MQVCEPLNNVDNIAENDIKALSNVNDYVHNPDFNSQDYYNWLSKFTEASKEQSMPLCIDLFQQISHVQKTLSDVLATPTGILSNPDNYKILMNICRDLTTVMNSHHSYILDNLAA